GARLALRGPGGQPGAGPQGEPRDLPVAAPARVLTPGGLALSSRGRFSFSDFRGGSRPMALVELTPAAQERVKALLDRDGKLETHGLRLKVVGGGCSGLQYQLGFDDQVREDDNEFHAGPVRILVD